MRVPSGGLRTWELQRISAGYLALFIVWFAAHLIFDPPPDYQHWRAWVAQPMVKTAFILFFVALLAHVWVGMRDLFMDYVKPVWARFILRLSMMVVLLAMAAWILQLLQRVVPA